MNKSKTNGNKKFRQNNKDKAIWHFPADNSIKSDVFGSYTGTPLMPEKIMDADDIYPVQDADDL